MLEKLDSHMQKNETRPLIILNSKYYISHNNLLIKGLKTEISWPDHKTPRGKHYGK